MEGARGGVKKESEAGDNTVAYVHLCGFTWLVEGGSHRTPCGPHVHLSMSRVYPLQSPSIHRKPLDPPNFLRPRIFSPSISL